MSYQEQTTLSQGTGLVDEKLQTDTILETAKTIPEISRFLDAITGTTLETDVRRPGFKTMFAPLNDSYGELDKDQVARHLVYGSQTEADLRTTSELKTFAGSPLRVEFESEGVNVGGSKIVRRDVACTDGHIHVIDKPVA